MKKIICGFMTSVLLLTSVFQGFLFSGKVSAANTSITIKLEGRKLVFKKSPLKVPGGYSAQANILIKKLGGKYKYDKKKKIVYLTKGKSKLAFYINSKKVMIGKKKENAKVKAVLKSNIPYIDVLYTAKKLGYPYSKYVAVNKSLEIYKKKPVATPSPVKITSVPQVTPTPVPWKSDVMKMYIVQDDPALGILKSPMAAPRDMAIKVVDGNDESKVQLAQTKGTIEGRGNSSWYGAQPKDWWQGPVKKAPFKLVFSNKVNMLGMGAAKKWVLLANRYDKSLIRNTIAFDIGGALSFAFTPRYRFVELYLNGDYKGLYTVTDQMEQDDIRVNIKNAAANDPEPAFMLEWDQKVNNDNWMFEMPGAIEGPADAPKLGRDYFMMTNIDNGLYTNGVQGVPFVYKYPKAKDLDTVPNDAARKYIQNYMTTASAAMKNCAGNNNYKNYIDVESFYDFYLVNEFAYNCDAASHSSIYMYKKKDGKLCMGPIWDFDISMGAVSATINPKAWLMNGGNGWYRSLIRDNSEFRTGLKARWNEVKSLIKEKSIDAIDGRVSFMGDAAKRNHVRWGELSLNLWDTSNAVPLPKTYEEEINYLKNWLNIRYAWLDSEINKW